MARLDGFAAAPAAGRSLEWELLSPALAPGLLDMGPFDVEEGLRRLSRGDRCYTVRLDGRLAHYSWVQASGSHPITEAGMSIPVGNGELWIYHCMTAAWARGKGIYPATLTRIAGDYFEAGCHSAWIYTTRENTASQKGILRAGFRQAATLNALRAGSHYFRLGRARQPEFRS
jgi:RimJ/RimL family protein N-acetyltransferase